MDLSLKRCRPLDASAKPFAPQEVEMYLTHLKSGWRAVENQKLVKEFAFNNFIDAMEFVNGVAELAESENHHPDISISFSRVVLSISTHSISGLSENDFILASKIEKL